MSWNLLRDDNYVPVAGWVSSTDPTVVLPILINPATWRVLTDGAWGWGGAFTDLSDVPSSYVGQWGKAVVVNWAETWLEFVPASWTWDMTKAVYDPTNINASAFVRSNHTGTQNFTTIVGNEITGNTTASNGGVYTVTASATFTDPSPSQGLGFTVIVRNWTATVWGVWYSIAWSEVIRIYHSWAWATYLKTPSSWVNTGDQTSIVGITGTIAEFNSACTDADFATIEWIETLSNKTLTAPKFADLWFIADANWNELIIMDTVASAQNEITIANSASLSAPSISATGGDTNINLDLFGKWTWRVRSNWSANMTEWSTDTITGTKTFSTAPVLNALPTGTAVVSGSSTASTLVARDANGNISMNNWINAYETTATSAGTKTLTVASPMDQFFTWSTTHTLTLPVASTLAVGHQFWVTNNSTGNVTVRSSGWNTVVSMVWSTSALFTCILASGTTAASWSSVYFGHAITTGKKLNISNTLTLAGTDGTTITFQGTDTYVGRATTDTLTNKTLTAPRFADLGFIADSNGNEMLIFDLVASAVNELTIGNNITANKPFIKATWGDTNIGLDISTKGTWSLTLWSWNLARELLILPDVASAVNELTITGWATGVWVTLGASWGDSNVDLNLASKWTGLVKMVDGFFQDINTATDWATVTFDCSLSNYHRVTLWGNRTLALSNIRVWQRIVIDLVQDATWSRTVTWFTTIKWVGWSAPTLTTTANKIDTIGIICTSSWNYQGYILWQNL